MGCFTALHIVSGCQSLTGERLMQASTALTFNFTSFTLANFTQSFFLNITNVNGTNVVPAGMSDNSGHTPHHISLIAELMLAPARLP